MMEEFQHILVPVDGSEPSVRALEKAVYLAEKMRQSGDAADRRRYE